MVNQSWPAASPESYTERMWGCWSRAAKRTSRWNRSGPSVAASSGRRTLSATSRSCLRSRARYTVAMPPRPSSRSRVYWPANPASSCAGRSANWCLEDGGGAGGSAGYASTAGRSIPIALPADEFRVVHEAPRGRGADRLRQGRGGGFDDQSRRRGEDDVTLGLGQLRQSLAERHQTLDGLACVDPNHDRFNPSLVLPDVDPVALLAAPDAQLPAPGAGPRQQRVQRVAPAAGRLPCAPGVAVTRLSGSGHEMQIKLPVGHPDPHDRSSTEQSGTCPSMMRCANLQQPTIAASSVEYVAGPLKDRNPPCRPISRSRVQRPVPRSWNVRTVMANPL